MARIIRTSNPIAKSRSWPLPPGTNPRRGASADLKRAEKRKKHARTLRERRAPKVSKMAWGLRWPETRAGSKNEIAPQENEQKKTLATILQRKMFYFILFTKTNKRQPKSCLIHSGVCSSRFFPCQIPLGCTCKGEIYWAKRVQALDLWKWALYFGIVPFQDSSHPRWKREAWALSYSWVIVWWSKSPITPPLCAAVYLNDLSCSKASSSLSHYEKENKKYKSKKYIFYKDKKTPAVISHLTTTVRVHLHWLQHGLRHEDRPAQPQQTPGSLRSNYDDGNENVRKQQQF